MEGARPPKLRAQPTKRMVGATPFASFLLLLLLRNHDQQRLHQSNWMTTSVARFSQGRMLPPGFGKRLQILKLVKETSPVVVVFFMNWTNRLWCAFDVKINEIYWANLVASVNQQKQAHVKGARAKRRKDRAQARKVTAQKAEHQNTTELRCHNLRKFTQHSKT